MVQRTASAPKQTLDSLIQECAAALQRVAEYKLPPVMDRRLLLLSENKESLTPSERDELHALITLSEDRTIDKLQAQVLLRRLAEACPQIFGSAP